jgi:Rod binding domain-containing protein
MDPISTSSTTKSSTSLWELGTNVANNSAKTSAMTDREKVIEAARGFETTLVRQMLKEVHNSPFNPKTESKRDGYLEMVDDQMAATITKGDGLGFAKKMVEQLLSQSEIAKQINAKN